MLKKESDEVNRMFQAKCLAFIRFFNACFVLVSYVKLRLLSSRFQVVSPNVVCNRNTNQIDEVQSMSRSEFYKSRAGAEGFKSFFQFLSLPPKTQKFPKGRGKPSRSLWSKLQSSEAECLKGNLCLEKAKCFSFRSRDWKDSESCAKSFQRENFQKTSWTSPIVQPCAGKNIDRVWFVAPQLWIYICLLYSLYICCFILTVAIASSTF